jgi:hypothetical protein
VAGYTKIFGSLLHSTVWQAPAPTRLVWITMLVLADRDGLVEASVPGLARAANVTLEECEAALAAFMSPDRYSRTPEHDGRRIEEVRGGWRLLNFEYYRDLKSAEHIREMDAERQRRKRNRDGGGEGGSSPAPAHAPSRSVTPPHGTSQTVTEDPPSGSGSGSGSDHAQTKPGGEKQSSDEVGGPTAPPPVLSFPCNDGRSWDLTRTQLAAWRALYPAVDVLAECRKALGWVQANPRKKKTYGGQAAFLNRWLSKAQDRGGTSPIARAGPGARSEGNVDALGDWLEKGAATG